MKSANKTKEKKKKYIKKNSIKQNVNQVVKININTNKVKRNKKTNQDKSGYYPSGKSNIIYGNMNAVPNVIPNRDEKYSQIYNFRRGDTAPMYASGLQGLSSGERISAQGLRVKSIDDMTNNLSNSLIANQPLKKPVSSLPSRVKLEVEEQPMIREEEQLSNEEEPVMYSREIPIPETPIIDITNEEDEPELDVDEKRSILNTLRKSLFKRKQVVPEEQDENVILEKLDDERPIRGRNLFNVVSAGDEEQIKKEEEIPVIPKKITQMTKIELVDRIKFLTGQDRNYGDMKRNELTKYYKELIKTPEGREKARKYDTKSSPIVLG